MIQKKRTFFLGIFIFLIPFLGVPTLWKTSFIILSGLTLIIFSIKISLPKKIPKRASKKEKINPSSTENIPLYPRSSSGSFSRKEEVSLDLPDIE